MVAAAPFRGLRFDPDVVGDHAQVTAPPYDVISPEARDAYEAMSPYNVVRLILARPDTDDGATAERDGTGDYGNVADLLARLVAVPAAAGALAWAGITLAPAVGAILMSASTIVVALNAQLLRRLDLQQRR